MKGRRVRSLLSLAMALPLLAVAPAQGVYKPPILKEVGIDQKLNVQVPGDLIFTDEHGREVHLTDYYDKRPLVLALVYYQCPMLCTMVLNNLSSSMGKMRISCGDDFDVLTVSFDPRDTPQLALQKKENYLRTYRRPHAANGWHFLTGKQPMIQKLTQTVGFHYKWDSKSGQFAHASGIILLSPQGKTTRYFYGIDYAPADLELSIADASGGKAVSVADQVLLYCFHYDPMTGRYSLLISRVVQACALLTLLVLCFGILMMQRLAKKRENAAGPGGAH